MKVNRLLLLLFIFSPFLITSVFLDPAIHIKRMSVFFLLTIILVVFNFYSTHSKKIAKNIDNIFYLFPLLLIYLFISSYFISTNLSESILEILYLCSWFLLYVVFIKYFNTDCIKLLIFITAIIGSALSLLVYNDIFNIFNINIISYGKLSATFGYKNFFAHYLCFVIPASLCSIFLVKKTLYKFLFLTCFFITSGALVFTRCRAAWLGVFIALILFLIINHKLLFKQFRELLNNKLSLLFTASFLIIFVYMIFTPVSIKSGIWIGDKTSLKQTLLSVKNINDPALWGNRIDMYNSSISMFKSSPLLGVGIGNWKVLNPGHSSNSTFSDHTRNKILLRPHNDLLRILAEAGLIGFSIFVFFFFKHIKILISKIRVSKSNDNFIVLLFCLISLTAISFESFLDFPSERIIPNLYFWVILAYIIRSTISNVNKSNTHFKKLPILFFSIIITTCIFYDIKTQYSIQNEFSSNKYLSLDELSYLSKYFDNSLKNIDYLAHPVAYHIGLKYQNKGDYDSALEMFNKSLSVSPYHYETLKNKMYLLIKDYKYDKAYEVLSDIIIYYPKLNVDRIKMAKYYIRAKRYDYVNSIISSFDQIQDEKILREINKIKDRLYEID